MGNSSSFWQEVNAVPGAILTEQGLLNQFMQQFQNSYYGGLSSAPTTRPDGSTSQGGDLYFDTTASQLKVYTGTAWILAAPNVVSLLQSGNNLSDLTSVSAALTNLGIAQGQATNSGTAQVNFGAYPGTDTASIAVADTGVTASSVITVTLQPTATTDHSADEHWVEGIYATAGAIVPGVGFTIYAASDGLWPLLQGAFNISWIRR